MTWTLFSLIITVGGSVPSLSTTESDQPVSQNVVLSLIVQHNFHHCYGIKINSRELNQPEEEANWNIPVVQITNTTSNHNYANLHPIVRHGRQCVVYEVSGNAKNDLLTPFQFWESLQRAKDSYIFINQVDTLASSALLSHPTLGKYPNKVRITTGRLHSGEKNRNVLVINSLCYPCPLNNAALTIRETIVDLQLATNDFRIIFPNDHLLNLNGQKLRITAPPAPPLVLITRLLSPRGKHNHEYDIYGQQKNIVLSMVAKFNFTFTVYPVPGGSTGAKLPNGTWTGVMGEILYDRADIGLTVATAYDRTHIADFTTPTFYAFLVLVSTKPMPQFEWKSIFYPFKRTAWIFIIASTIFTLFLYKVVHNQSLLFQFLSHAPRKRYLHRKSIRKQRMTNFRAFYMMVGSFLEQGVPVDFRPTPSRMIAAGWMIFAIIITCGYRSKLFAFLISPTIQTPPSSFEELSQSEYNWGMKSLGGVALGFIRNSPLSYIRHIGQNMEIYTDKYSCLDKTFYTRFTCIIYRAYIDYMMEVRYWKLKPRFHISDFVTPPVGSAWALTKFSPLKPGFDDMSNRILEMGLGTKYLDDYQVAYAKEAREAAKVSNDTDEIFQQNTMIDKNDDSITTGGRPKPLKLGNLYGPFCFLGCGVFTSCLALIAEWASARRRRHWRKKQKAAQGSTDRLSPPSLSELNRRRPTPTIELLTSVVKAFDFRHSN